MKTWGRIILAVTLGSAAVGCGQSSESPRVLGEVYTGTEGVVRATNDLEWTVELRRAEVRFRNPTFTTRGEAHSSFAEWLVPNAWAHPGHLAGGDVIGELTGSFTADFASEPAKLGQASLIAGKYEGMNFAFDPDNDGIAVLLEGTATKGELAIEWAAAVPQDADRVVSGVAFDRLVTADSTAPITMRFQVRDETDGETIFDGIDFAQPFEPGAPSIARLTRATQRHDFWTVE